MSAGRSRQSQGRWMDLRYAGKCAICGDALPAGTRAFYDPRDRTVCCTGLKCAEEYGVTTQEWIGSPVSGSWVRTLSAYRVTHPSPTT